MEVLQIFGSLDQEIASWFINHEPLIPTLYYENTWKAELSFLMQILEKGFWFPLWLGFILLMGQKPQQECWLLFPCISLAILSSLFIDLSI